MPPFDPVAQRKIHLAQLGLDSPVKLTIPEILDRSASLQGFDRRRLRKRPTHISLHTIKERRESGAH